MSITDSYFFAGNKCYLANVKTIEEIRLDNYKRLIDEFRAELGRDPKGVELAARFNIAPAYVSQLENKRRENIDSQAARKIEEGAGKPRGWLDADANSWPFQDIERARFDRLSLRQQIEIQGVVRERMERFESPPAASGMGSEKSRAGRAAANGHHPSKKQSNAR